MDKIIQAIREEEARLSDALKLNPTYRRLRSIRALLATYAETGGDAQLPGEPEAEKVDTGEPAAKQEQPQASPPEVKVQHFPARRRGGERRLLPKTIRKNKIVEDAVAVVTGKGVRMQAREIAHVLNASGHEIKLTPDDLSHFCNLLIKSGRFNNQRGREGGYGLQDWPIVTVSERDAAHALDTRPQVSVEQGEPVVAETSSAPLPEANALEHGDEATAPTPNNAPDGAVMVQGATINESYP